jgi:hypothetical protein
MYPDFKELLSVFNAHNVKYLIVGLCGTARRDKSEVAGEGNGSDSHLS